MAYYCFFKKRGMLIKTHTHKTKRKDRLQNENRNSSGLCFQFLVLLWNHGNTVYVYRTKSGLKCKSQTIKKIK